MITWSTLCNVVGLKKLRTLELEKADDVKLEQWDGQPLPVRGRYKINVKLGTWFVKDVPVLVADRAPSGFVIGNDLLARGGRTVIDWRKQLLSIGTRRPVPFTHSPTKARMAEALEDVRSDEREQLDGGAQQPVYSVHVLEDQLLAPRQARFVAVCVYSSLGPPPQLTEDFIFEPSEAYQKRLNVNIAEGLSNASACTSVFVTNCGNDVAHLREGDLVGVLATASVLQPADSTHEQWREALANAGIHPDKLMHPRDFAAYLASADDAEPMAIVGEKDRTEDSVQQPPGLGNPSAVNGDEILEKLDIASDAPPAQRAILRDLVRKYGLFCPPIGVGLSKAPPAEIKLKPGAVINNRNYGSSNIERQQAAMEIAQKMEEGGIIQRSTSPYNSPVVLARKADGTWRFCVDYRQINAVTERDGYQLPRTNDLLNLLGRAKIFSVLDLASASWQIRLAEGAQQYTAFSLLSGHWEFRVLPMGMTNSPAVMQRALEDALGDILYHGALAYIDDIIVYGATWEEHNERLKEVLRRLHDYGFHTRPDKCRFGYRLVKFLGHVIGEHGIRPWEGNLAKIRNCAIPTDTKQLESALALFSYYRRFVPRYACIARPLVDRLTAEQRALREAGRNSRRGRRPLLLTETEIEAFEELKRRLTADNNLLALPDFDKHFVLESDSSDFFGHVTLSQYEGNSKTRLRPVAFHSFRLPTARWKRGAYEREFYCVIEGVRHFSNYLDHLGCFEVRVDQQALRYLHTQARTNPSYGNWVQVLSPYEIKWVYQPADKHRHVDCFTRPPFTEDIAARMGDTAYVQEQLLDGAAPASMCVLCRDGPEAAGKCNMRIHEVEHLTPEQARFSLGRGYRGEDATSPASPAAAPLPAAALLEEERRSDDPTIEYGPEDEGGEENEGEAFVRSEDDETHTESSSDEPARVPLPRSVDELRRRQRQDPQLAPIIAYHEALRDKQDTSAFSPQLQAHARHYVLGVNNGLLYYIGLEPLPHGVDDDGLPLAVPLELREEFLRAFHADASAGHLGFKKAYYRMARQCYWPNMARDLIDFEKVCESCMAHKLPRRGPVSALHSISATRPWEMVGMDVLGPLPRTRRGYAYVFVFMDYFTRYVIVRPLRTQTAPEIARTLVGEVFLDRAPPARLLSDRGAAFLSDLLTEVYKYFRVHKVNTSAYHPQTDGMVERFNHTIVAMLSHYVGCEQNDWDDYLLCVQFAYNTAVHASMGHAPHEVLHGWAARSPALASLGFDGPDVGPLEWRRRVDQNLAKMHQLVTDLDARAKRRAELRRAAVSKEIHFAEGQLVWRRREARGNKLEPKLDGPYRVVKVNDSNDTYKIKKVADGPNATEEWVFVDKLYPNRVPYDPAELDRLADEEASDADEPEYRPPEESQRPAPSRSAAPAASRQQRPDARNTPPRGAVRSDAAANESARSLPLRHSSASTPARPQQSAKSSEQRKEERMQQLTERLIEALDNFVKENIADSDAKVSKRLLSVLYMILEIYYAPGEIDEKKAEFRHYVGRTVGELIAAITTLQQELREQLTSSPPPATAT